MNKLYFEHKENLWYCFNETDLDNRFVGENQLEALKSYIKHNA